MRQLGTGLAGTRQRAGDDATVHRLDRCLHRGAHGRVEADPRQQLHLASLCERASYTVPATRLVARMLCPGGGASSRLTTRNPDNGVAPAWRAIQPTA